MDQFLEAILASRHACKDAAVPVAEIATIAQLRQALGSITTIISKLSPALKIDNVALLYNHRRKFLALMPQIGAIYEAASQLLQARGATSTPTAGKVADAAQELRDMVVNIKTNVDIAAEFHELLSEVIPAIRSALQQPSPIMQALKQSVSILPERIGILLNRTKSLPQFDKVTTELIEAATDLADRVEQRDAELLANQSDHELDLKPPRQRSPLRPQLAVLRGVTVRKSSRLNLSEVRMKPTPLLTIDDDLIGKENPISSPRKRKVASRDNYSSRIPQPTPILNRHIDGSPGPVASSKAKHRHSFQEPSRITKPTAIKKRNMRRLSEQMPPPAIDLLQSPVFSDTSNSSILKGMVLSTPGQSIDTPIPARRMRLKHATSTPQLSIGGRLMVSPQMRPRTLAEY